MFDFGCFFGHNFDKWIKIKLVTSRGFKVDAQKRVCAVCNFEEREEL